MCGGEKLVEERVREELGMGEVENERDGVMEESAWQRKRQSCSTTTS